MRVYTEVDNTDYIAHLNLWKHDLIEKMEACTNDMKAHQEWLHQYLRVCVLIKKTKKK